LGASTYISLTTFRKDGRAVATPVWVARDGDSLFVITDLNSGKVKRLRNNPSVVLGQSDVRGRLTGPEVPGTAVVLDADRVPEVRRLIAAKYGLTYRVMLLGDRVRPRRKQSQRVGIEITLAQ